MEVVDILTFINALDMQIGLQKKKKSIGKMWQIILILAIHNSINAQIRTNKMSD